MDSLESLLPVSPSFRTLSLPLSAELRLHLRYWWNFSESGLAFERSLFAALLVALQESDPNVMKVLDFGCGSAPYRNLIRNLGASYIGVDVYPGSSVDLIYDGNSLPLASDSIDIVFCSSVFEHVEDLTRSLSEIERVLKPGGILIAVTPFINHLHSTPFDYHRPTRFGWSSMVRRIFGNDTHALVTPVDGRIGCLANLVSAQMNLVLLSCLRSLSQQLRGSPEPIVAQRLDQGAASPEYGGDLLAAAYMVARLNPLNFLLGFCALLSRLLPAARRAEGEITSGYLLRVRKRTGSQ